MQIYFCRLRSGPFLDALDRNFSHLLTLSSFTYLKALVGSRFWTLETPGLMGGLGV